MATCAVCGYDAAEVFKFCPECGATLGADGREQRKVVTVLFCDVVGSTALGETTDPRQYVCAAGALVRADEGDRRAHGVTAKRFTGDAAVALFGAPRCKRTTPCGPAGPQSGCVRPARSSGWKAARHQHGRGGDGHRGALRDRDPVNVAARLQRRRSRARCWSAQARSTRGARAPPRCRSARAARAERKGRAGRAPVLAGATRARANAPRLSGASASSRSCARPGGGPAEGAAARDRGRRSGRRQVAARRRAARGLDARVVRPLPPLREGITYWPVVEVIKQLDALPTDRGGRSLDPSAAAARREQAPSADEIAWAFRKLLEEQAPLVVSSTTSSGARRPSSTWSSRRGCCPAGHGAPAAALPGPS